jgi:uncharacterized protein YndB with AHSA1/START domain
MKRKIELQAVYAHSPEHVWSALTDPEALAQWLMPQGVLFAPRVGHRFQFKTKPQAGWNGVTDCEVLAVDPPKFLSYTFEGGGIGRTVVSFRLTAVPTGTRLEIVHDGFEGLKAVLIGTLFMKAGWRKMLRTRIRAVLDERVAAAPEHLAAAP